MTHPQITLRAIEPEDLDELYAIENDCSIWNVGHTSVPYSRYALHEYIAHSSSDIYADRQVRMMIVAEGETVGIVDVVNFDPAHRRAEVGIVIKEPYRQQGYAKAALQAVVRHARQTWHMHQLYVIVDVRNEASVSLFRQQGFVAGTLLKDWLYDGTEYHDAMLLQIFF